MNLVVNILLAMYWLGKFIAYVWFNYQPSKFTIAIAFVTLALAFLVNGLDKQ